VKVAFPLPTKNVKAALSKEQRTLIGASAKTIPKPRQAFFTALLHARLSQAPLNKGAFSDRDVADSLDLAIKFASEASP
jgi:hypothetical protein